MYAVDGSAIAQGAARGLSQAQVSGMRCVCGHTRAGHRGYYMRAPGGVTYCVEKRDCGCPEFRQATTKETTHG